MEEYKFNLDKCNSIEVPSEINNTISGSIIRARAHQKRKKIIIKYFSSIAASLAIFIAFINMSPAIASNLSKVPGLEYLVELVSFDNGLRSAVDNNYVQHIGKSAEDKNIKLTIKDVIVDKKSMIIAYEIASKDKKYNDVDISYQLSIEIISEENKELISTVRIGSAPDENFKIKRKKDGVITVDFNDNLPKLPNSLIVKVREMQDSHYEGIERKTERINGDWTISFNIDTKLASVKPYSYAINKSIDINKLSVQIKDLVIYPTRGEINYQLKDSGDNKFINFINARLVDDRGQEYRMRGSQGTVDNLSGTLFCESTYFAQSKELYFKADGALFIKKGMQIIVDLKNKKILDDCGFDMEFLYGRFENRQNEKIYDAAFKIKDKEILEMTSLPGAYFGGIGYSEVMDEKNNKYNRLGIFYTSDTKDLVTGEEYIRSGVSIYDITEEPEILKLKVQYANRGILEPISIKVK